MSALTEIDADAGERLHQELARLGQELATGEIDQTRARELLDRGHQMLASGFEQGAPAPALVHGRTRLLDHLLSAVWQQFLGPCADCLSLIAVGGYGRGELHPFSDIDLLILLPEQPPGEWTGRVETLVGFLWDSGLEIGHAVRNLDECRQEATADLTTITNLTESRLIAGNQSLFQAMQEATSPDHMWDSRTFFEAKWEEQQQRHRKYHGTAYELEPNVKESPGGLRDIQMIGWVAKRHFRARGLPDLVDHAFLTEHEYHSLMDGQHFLWRVRFAMHLLTGRHEDRLLFDHQLSLARHFGFEDKGANLAVEQFMQLYYRQIKRLGRLNEMLLQLFEENILHAGGDETPVPINKRFQARRGYLEVTHEKVFERYPFALMEIFLVLQQNPWLKGVRASTIRLIRQHRKLIDDDFRNDIRTRSLFMEILRQPHGITHVLRRMNRYGILARYLPAFGQIVGRMQFDLFHAYTVDQHTLFVVRNLRRVTVPEHYHEYPLCSDVMARIPKPELLYLAGLFHDIAKGRGGDHSVLGAIDARDFCLHHGLSAHDSELVAWLVEQHLLMSKTAQRRDITDPDEIHEFACKVGSQVRLDYLFLLTVADMRGTNPQLLNSWKFSLLSELYQAAGEALKRGLENPVNPAEWVQENQQEALARLEQDGCDKARARELWLSFPDEYFLRNQPEDIAWETGQIMAHDSDGPLVRVRADTERGSMTLLLYTPDRDYLFGLVMAVVNQLGLTVEEARINSTTNGYALDTYIVLEESGEPVTTEWRTGEIEQTLTSAISDPEPSDFRVNRRMPRRIRAFTTPTQVSFSQDEINSRTVLELVTGDRPGLLSHVGRIFEQHDIRVHTAKIATLGERAEDVFYISDTRQQPLDDPERQQRLREALREALDQEQTS